MIIVAVLLNNGEKERDLTFNFDNSTYRKSHPRFTTPEEMSEPLRGELDFYCPSVMALADFYYSSGPEQALLALHEKLSSSTDETELLEIQETLRDPEIVFDLFMNREEPMWNDNQRAAADYLVALAFDKGNFQGSLLSEEEEKVANDYDAYSKWNSPEAEEANRNYCKKLRGVKDEGKDRLMIVWKTYSHTRVGMLAGFNYLVETAEPAYEATDFATAKELLQTSMDNYPDTAFLTMAYMQVGNWYRTKHDTEKALEYYRMALTCPDYRDSSNDQMTHELAGGLIQKLEN